jgi:hypothetical protein
MEGSYLTSYGVKEDNILTERAKSSFPNFQEGKDYTKLKNAVNDAKYYCSLSDEELVTGRRGFMHFFKRYLQIYEDLSTILCSAMGIKFLVSGHPFLLGCQLAGVLTSRLLRLLFDSIEFENIEKDANTVLYNLYKIEFKLKKAGNKNQELADIRYSINNLETTMKKTNCKITARRPNMLYDE